MILAYENATIQAVVNGIARFEHRAPARQGAVVADKRQLGTQVARRLRIKSAMRVQTRHFASILLAADKTDDVIAFRHTGA